MDRNAFNEYSEYVSAKLREWADPQTRLEKKRIQKQNVNQNCRDWLKDLVSLDQVEIEMLAEDEGEANRIKKDHASYVRKALFDEYTFKKKPITKDMLEERQQRIRGRTRTLELLDELKREQRAGTKTSCDTEYSGFLRRHESTKDPGSIPSTMKGKRWFSRPWLTKRGVSHESVCVTDDRKRRIIVTLEKLIKEALEEGMKGSALETMKLLKAGILFDAIYTKVREMVNAIVDNARSHVEEADYKWLDKINEESPETITDNMIDEIFEEAPLSYFENKILKHFVEAYSIPVMDELTRRGVLSEDSTLVTTKFDRQEIISLIKQTITSQKHVCTNFTIAERVAKVIAQEVVDVARFRLDLPAPESEPSEPERDIKALYEQKLADIRKAADKQARKSLEYLRDPGNLKKEPFKIDQQDDTQGKNNCRCSTISELGGKKRPFSFPEYKKKANYYFYQKFISERNKNHKSGTLYPKTKPHIKYVCDDHWNCIEVPLERELRDIPYRFSYAPQYVVKQIQRTKSIKKSDHPLIGRILTKMEETKKHVDMDAILKKIDEEKSMLQLKNIAAASSTRSTSDVKVTISAKSLVIGESSSHSVQSRTKKVQDGKRASKPRFMTSHSAKISFDSADGSRMMKAVIPPQTRPRIVNAVSRESQVLKAPDPMKYHEYILQGYKYDMIPITPCRFHSLKKIKAVLKRFETAGGPAALEYHFESRLPPVSVDELLPIPRLVDIYRQWRQGMTDQDSSPWTRALNDSRLKRMARFRKIHHKDPVFGFMSNWESPTYKCPL